MPAKGMQQVRRNVKRILGDISGKNAEAAVMEALIIGAGMAMTLTPMDTGTLANSQYRKVDVDGTKVHGMVGYTAAYAAAVHRMSGKLKGQPRADFGKTRAGVEFGGGTGNGNYWDPAAEPEFLTKGFEKTRKAIDAAVLRRMKI